MRKTDCKIQNPLHTYFQSLYCFQSALFVILLLIRIRARMARCSRHNSGLLKSCSSSMMRNESVKELKCVCVGCGENGKEIPGHVSWKGKEYEFIDGRPSDSGVLRIFLSVSILIYFFSAVTWSDFLRLGHANLATRELGRSKAYFSASTFLFFSSKPAASPISHENWV